MKAIVMASYICYCNETPITVENILNILVSSYIPLSNRPFAELVEKYQYFVTECFQKVIPKGVTLITEPINEAKVEGIIFILLKTVRYLKWDYSNR